MLKEFIKILLNLKQKSSPPILQYKILMIILGRNCLKKIKFVNKNFT